MTLVYKSIANGKITGGRLIGIIATIACLCGMYMGNNPNTEFAPIAIIGALTITAVSLTQPSYANGFTICVIWMVLQAMQFSLPQEHLVSNVALGAFACFSITMAKPKNETCYWVMVMWGLVALNSFLLSNPQHVFWQTSFATAITAIASIINRNK